MVYDDDLLHAAADDPGKLVAPTYVQVSGGKYVAQYGPTVVSTVDGYDPLNDCQGNFMSYKFQANNNCYNYSANIASNSFAQPGRMHGLFLPSPPTGPVVVEGAQMDGLTVVGEPHMTPAGLQTYARGRARTVGSGHYVALLISDADSSAGWPGDYHWVRCDDPINFASWSQKDGGDQVTNFDFAGQPISNPQAANWTVNQGPLVDGNPDDVVVAYDFYAYLFVPNGAVTLI
jgi:hypothetical protein